MCCFLISDHVMLPQRIVSFNCRPMHLHPCVYSYFEKGCRKNVHATIPKGNMGYDQYTVSDDCTCWIYFGCFPLALANTVPRPFTHFTHLKPPTMPFGIVACTFSDTFLEIAACMDHLWKDERQIPWRTSRGLNYENKFKLKRSIRQIFELVFSLWRLVLTSIMVAFSAADIFRIFLKYFLVSSDFFVFLNNVSIRSP